MKPHLIILIAAWCLVAGDLTHAQGVYTPIPSSGFDFPADEAALLLLRDNKDVPGMRTHSWNVFAGLTSPARPAEPDSEAVWETWFYGDAVFSPPPPPGAGPQGAEIRKRKFTPLRQLQVEGVAPQAAGQSLASFTLFNKETKDHIRTNKYQMRQTMNALNASWAAGTEPKNRKIADFPRTSMSLKTVWWVVKKQAKTGMYIWDDIPPADAANLPPPNLHPQDSWERLVVIDPTRDTIPASEKQDFTVNGKLFHDCHVVPLKSFYHFAATADDAAAFNAFTSGLGINHNGNTVEAGDFIVLAAMHYTTKEIPDWVWATFWWHDRPDEGPYASDRPDATKLKGVWRNYKMDVSFDMVTPVEADGKPNAVFNPWLEGSLVRGVTSNCMTCHQQAVWPSKKFRVTRGPLPENAPLFKTGTKADFVWAIMMEGDKP